MGRVEVTDVVGELGQLLELGKISGPAAAAVFDAAGWAGERRNPAKEWATTWRRDDVHVRTPISMICTTPLPSNSRGSSPSWSPTRSAPGWSPPTEGGDEWEWL